MQELIVFGYIQESLNFEFIPLSFLKGRGWLYQQVIYFYVKHEVECHRQKTLKSEIESEN